MRTLGIHIVAVFTTFSVFYSSLNFFIPLVTDPEQERTSRECAAYMSASRLQSKHYSPFKLIVQISKVTLTFQPSPPDQVFWTKREVYYQPTINLAEGLPICVRQMEA